jgi:hypothetical protein
MTTTELCWRHVPALSLEGSSSESARFAVAELRRYLTQILGEQTGSASAIQLRVDASAGLTDEGYSWHAKGNDVHLTAGGELGLVFGVYAFLRDVCGCRFCGLGPDGEFIPRHTELRASCTPVRREPKLWYRSLEFYYYEHPQLLQQTIDWMAKNGFNYVLYHFGTEDDESLLSEEVDPKTGNKIFPESTGRSMFSEEFFNQYLLPEIQKRGLKLDFNDHNLCYWMPPAKYAEKHPEWFAEIDGKHAQKFTQLCLCTSNREAVAELCRRVNAFLRTHPDVRIVAVAPEDGHGVCQCEKCRAMDDNPNDAFAIGRDYRDPKNENRSAIRRYALLLNEVARSIRQEFPHVLLSAMAYVDLQWPPRDVTLEDNITFMVALYWRDGARPLAPTRTSAINQFFFDLLRQWRGVFHGRLLVYEYYMGMMAQRNLPYPMARVIEKDWNAMEQLPIDGAMIQCTPGCIQSYLLNLLSFSRCAWGERVDVDKQLDDYLLSMFGNAGRELRSIFQRLQEAVDALADDAPVSVEFDPRRNDVRSLQPEATNIAYFWERLDESRVRQALDKARSAAKTPKEQKAVDDFGKYLRYCELAARSMATLRRIENAEKSNPAEAQRLRVQRLEHELPAVIALLETTRLKGWVLPRILTQWKNDLKKLQQQMDVEQTACAKS